MRKKQQKRLNLSVSNENIDPDFQLVSSTNNRSTSFFFNSTSATSKPSSKNKLKMSHAFTSKITKIPLQPSKNDNIVRVSQWFPESKVKSHIHKQSTIEFLKKQFQYLEQDDMDHYQFPSHEINFGPNRHSQQKINPFKLKNYCSRVNIVETAKNDSKGFIIAPMRQKSLFQRKIKRSCLKNKQKSTFMNDESENIQKIGKTFSKFELIAPYRKYFQSNRFHKNKSCTMKIDEIMGRRITKLFNVTLQDLS